MLFGFEEEKVLTGMIMSRIDGELQFLCQKDGKFIGRGSLAVVVFPLSRFDTDRREFRSRRDAVHLCSF